MKRLLGVLRRADEAYHLIEPEDVVGVGVSGGKDSMALLRLLSVYRQFAPHPFTLKALTIQIGEPFDGSALEALCQSWQVPFFLRKTDLLPTLEREKNPCSLCARLRRGTLCQMAKDEGCTKLALAHHREDALETLVMSALHEGRFYALAPKAPMERMGITVIRPLIDAREEALRSLARKEGLPVLKNPCPMDGHTRRADIKALLSDLEKRCPGANEQLASALRRARLDPASPFAGPRDE